MSETRPDPSSPWVVDTRLLGRRAGTMKTVKTSLVSENPIGIEVIAVPAGTEVDVDLRLESVVEGILVSGTAFSVAEGECARCLIEISQNVEARVRELYAFPDSSTAQTIEDDEILILEDDMIDLEPLVRDELTLKLPLAPLCQPDCPGLCSMCGERLADLEPDHNHEIVDARWAALRSQFESISEVEEK